MQWLTDLLSDEDIYSKFVLQSLFVYLNEHRKWNLESAMYVCCAYTATSYMQFFFTKFTHKKAKSFDILIEIPIGYPQRGPSVYFSSFYLKGYCLPAA